MTYQHVPLSRVTEAFISGGTPNTKNSVYWSGNIPWITGADIIEGEVKIGRRFINETALDQSAAHLVPKGSILLVTRTGVGKIAIAPEDIAISQDITGIILKKGFIEKFVVSAIMNQMRVLINIQRGATIKGVIREDIEKLQIPIMSEAEQKRIVAILDQADALRKKRSDADTKAERIIPSLFYEMFGDPATNPKLHPILPIRSLVEQIVRRNPSDEPDTAFKYVDIASIDGMSGKITDYKVLIGRDAPSRARQVIQTNDVLISTVRPYLRATALVPGELNNEICSTGLCVLRARDHKGYGYFYALSRLSWFTESLNSIARGASYPAVSDNDILGLYVPYPRDQSRIEQVDLLIMQFLEMQNKRMISTKVIDNLFATLLQSAFAGNLTAKWREAHLKELLDEMEDQAKFINISSTNN